MAKERKAPESKGGIDRWTSSGVSIRATKQTDAYKKQVAQLKKELAQAHRK